MTTRLTRSYAHLEALEQSHALVTNLLDVAWLSGFRGSNGALLVGGGQQVLLTDFRYRTQAAEEAPDWELVQQNTGEKLPAALARVLGERGITAVAAQSAHFTHAAWLKLQEALGETVALVPCDDLITSARKVKDADEIATIRRAAALADTVMAKVPEIAAPGVTEQDLRAELEYAMFRLGAEKAAFDVIVCAGPNSAKCHAKPGPRPMADGDLLTVDLGCVVDGYHSDLTRSWAIGSAGEDQRRIYATVHSALQAGIDAIRPGAAGKDVDAVARQIISDAGHGDDFGHSLGHGVGLQIHEGPGLSQTSEDTLEPGHVVTVEPGIYVEGLGGVRIEELCLVTADGCEVISQVARPAEVWVL